MALIRERQVGSELSGLVEQTKKYRHGHDRGPMEGCRCMENAAAEGWMPLQNQAGMNRIDPRRRRDHPIVRRTAAEGTSQAWHWREPLPPTPEGPVIGPFTRDSINCRNIIGRVATTMAKSMPSDILRVYSRSSSII